MRKRLVENLVSSTLVDVLIIWANLLWSTFYLRWCKYVIWQITKQRMKRLIEQILQRRMGMGAVRFDSKFCFDISTKRWSNLCQHYIVRVGPIITIWEIFPQISVKTPLIYWHHTNMQIAPLDKNVFAAICIMKYIYKHWNVVYAINLGSGFSWLPNKDKGYSWLRKLMIKYMWSV